MADVTQDAAESEMCREHQYPEKEAEWDNRLTEKQAERGVIEVQWARPGWIPGGKTGNTP